MSQVEEALSLVRAAPVVPAARPGLRLSMPWAVVVAAAVVAAYLPLVVVHCQHLLDRVQYGFFPLVPVGAFFLAQQRLRGAGQLAAGNLVVFSLLMGWAFLLSAFAVVVFSPMFGTVALLFAVLACAYGFGGWSCVGRILPAWLFLWFIIPLPFQLDQKLILSLQATTAQWSSKLLDAAGVLHVLSGNTVEIPGHKLLVEEACSGVRSLFVILAFTSFFILFFRVPIVRGVLLLAGSVLFVLIANVIRVVLITWLTRRGYEVVEGLPHELLGVGVFLLAMGTVLSFDRLLMFFLPPKGLWYKTRGELARATGGALHWPRWQTTWLAHWPSVPTMALYGFLAGAQLYLLWPSGTQAEVASSRSADAAFEKLSADQMPADWNSWHRVGFFSKARQSFAAALSRYWAYRAGNDKLIASIDYPFEDWHNLLDCYQAVGWSVQDQTQHGPESDPVAPRFEVNLNRANLQYGYLLFFLFDSQGRPLDPRTFSFGERLVKRIEAVPETWSAAGQNLADGTHPQYYQFQVFLESYTPISAQDRERVREFYRMGCQKLRTQWLPDVAGAAGVPEHAEVKPSP